MPDKYREMLITSVASSTAIETGEDVEEIKKRLSVYADKYLRSPEAPFATAARNSSAAKCDRKR